MYVPGRTSVGRTWHLGKGALESARFSRPDKDFFVGRMETILMRRIHTLINSVHRAVTYVPGQLWQTCQVSCDRRARKSVTNAPGEHDRRARRAVTDVPGRHDKRARRAVRDAPGELWQTHQESWQTRQESFDRHARRAVTDAPGEQKDAPGDVWQSRQKGCDRRARRAYSLQYLGYRQM